jgi:hypothetical protein
MGIINKLFLSHECRYLAVLLILQRFFQVVGVLFMENFLVKLAIGNSAGTKVYVLIVLPKIMPIINAE